MHDVTIWRMGQFYKVESSDTGLIRPLANANNCSIGASYFEKERLVGLDAILPFKAKYGRRIFKILRRAGFKPIGKWPNLAPDEILTLKRSGMALNRESVIKTDI